MWSGDMSGLVSHQVCCILFYSSSRAETHVVHGGGQTIPVRSACADKNFHKESYDGGSQADPNPPESVSSVNS